MLIKNTTDEKQKQKKIKSPEKKRRGKKIASKILSGSFNRLGYWKKAKRVFKCADELHFLHNPKELTDRVFNHTENCHVPLCPICAAYRTDKLYAEVLQMFNLINERHGYRYIFVTLTMKNIKEGGLEKAVKDLSDGVNTLTKRAGFLAMSKGYMRSIETTVNWKKEEFHPHVHMVIAVEKSYFSKGSDIYMSHEELMALWRSCMKLDYDPVVHIKAVRRQVLDAKSEITYPKAAAELTKYAVKPSDYLVTWAGRKEFLEETSKKDKFGNVVESGIKLQDRKHAERLTDWAVSALSEALHGKRMVSFGGVMREVRKEVKALIKKQKQEKAEVYEDWFESVETWNPFMLDYLLNAEKTDVEILVFMEYEQRYGRAGPGG